MEEDTAEYFRWEAGDWALRIRKSFVKDALVRDRIGETIRRSVRQGSWILYRKPYAPFLSLTVRHRSRVGRAWESIHPGAKRNATLSPGVI